MTNRVLLLLSVAVAVVLAALGMAGAATHGEGLDRAYGTQGVARILPPGGVEGDSQEGESPYAEARAFAAADDGSAYVIVRVGECGARCRNGLYIYRFDRRGKLDRKFGGDGRVPLPPSERNLTVATDHLGRPVVAELSADVVTVRRFTRAGDLDRGFGQGGSARLPCKCGSYAQLRVLRAPRGRTLIDVNVPLYGHPESMRGFRARVFRLGPGGRPDRSFGGSGSIGPLIHQPELPASVVIAPDGSILLGGSSCCGPREVFVERIDADGRLDRRFGRVTASSVRRLNTLGEFPTLAAALPRPGGGVDVVGASQARHGFYLRLLPDGRLARSFGRRGLVRLPFIVSTAARGLDEAVFAVADDRFGGYSAFRILANGHLDPGYRGDRGIDVPLGGVRAHVAAAGPGRVLIFNNGNSFCRSGCASEPALARFLESTGRR